MRLIVAGQEVALVLISPKQDAPEDIFKITFLIDSVQRAAFRHREHKGGILSSYFTSNVLAVLQLGKESPEILLLVDLTPSSVTPTVSAVSSVII